MNAEEARNIASGQHKKRMEIIYKEIRKAAEDQKLHTFWYKSLYDAEKEELRRNGFEVEDLFDRNESFHRISWVVKK
jgi:hypothetical protein